MYCQYWQVECVGLVVFAGLPGFEPGTTLLERVMIAISPQTYFIICRENIL